ncbi:MAG: PEP/pyruvate-binding domain-containing protein [Eubacteriales bacterium]|nr:PEP/pyruvate-binding domain-containing protein [Eubacteriales bacterium]
MGIHDKVSTGLSGLDQIIDKLRLGDNVVWKVDSVLNYKKLVAFYVAQAISDNRKIIYVRFGIHEPLLDDAMPIKVYQVKPEKGFENFAAEVYGLVAREGEKAFYVFDCLTDLLEYWHSDVMINNFFRIICPFLYELDTVAYFAIIRNVHTFGTIASIRETTQLLLDLFQIHDKMYLHPLKVWKRYSPTMFLPHLIQGQDVVSITASAEAAGLFSKIIHNEKRLDYWYAIFEKAKQGLKRPCAEQEEIKRHLMSVLIGEKSRMFTLCDRYFSLKDILAIAEREIGTGFIGGKSIGMLIARKALDKEGGDRFTGLMEPHDSFYIGSDIFYTYIVQNGWWKLRTKQKAKDGYYQYAEELKEKILHGKFPEEIQQQFIQMLEYFGQSPIIVRSSSLLEDNFGNAFSGKYDSVFCVNQGTPDERYDAFEQAVRIVYASTMNEDALSYRMNRGLFDADEQMAILVQRVSGDYYNENFFPHIAGVGNSTNLYVWDQNIDMSAGMLRLVFGLGTRAVDRTTGDYVRIVCLDDPMRLSPMDHTDLSKYSQHHIDVLSIKENILTDRPLEIIFSQDIKTDKDLFIRQDFEKMNRLRQLGYSDVQPSNILDFKKLLELTDFPRFMKDMLALLSRVYDYPVDIEFTANFTGNQFNVNLLQCRPLQTRGLGASVDIPDITDKEDCFFFTKGNFMGGNVHLPIEFVVLVDTHAYLKLTEQEKYAVARQIGRINASLKGWNVMLVGPGRWGTTTPSIGVPVHFSEISNMSAICEAAEEASGFRPELSYGSHFFQDLVEMEIFYAAIFAGDKDVVYNPGYVKNKPNILQRICPDQKSFSNVIHICKFEKLEIFSDIVSQKVLCK